MKAAASLLGVVVAIAVVVTIGAGSRVSWSYGQDDRAVLRLSWRAAAGRVETCRPLTREEEERVPVHMRRSRICETTGLPYLLRLAVDGVETIADTVRPAGARADRPVVVFQEIELEPGTHDVRVEFFPLSPPVASTGGLASERDDEGRDELAEDEQEDEQQEEDEEESARLEPLRLTRSFRLAPGEVGLITYDPRREGLVLRQPSARGDR